MRAKARLTTDIDSKINIAIYNSFEIRNTLKEKGYKYLDVKKCWFIEPFKFEKVEGVFYDMLDENDIEKSIKVYEFSWECVAAKYNKDVEEVKNNSNYKLKEYNNEFGNWVIVIIDYNGKKYYEVYLNGEFQKTQTEFISKDPKYFGL